MKLLRLVCIFVRIGISYDYLSVFDSPTGVVTCLVIVGIV